MQSLDLEKLIEIQSQLGYAVVIFEVRQNGSQFFFSHLNTKATKIERIKKEKVIGKEVREIFPEIEKFGLFEIFQQVYLHGETKVHNISYYEDDRISGWRENTVSKISPSHIVSFYQDRKNHLETLSRWSQVFHNAKWGIVIGNKVMEDMNETFAQMHGYSRQELLGKPFSMLFLPKFKLPNKKSDYQFESIHLKKDGSQFPVLLDITTATDAKNKQNYRILNVQDLTKQKKDQKKQVQDMQTMKEILEFFPVPVLIYNKKLDVTFINQKFTDLLGYRLCEIPKLTDWTSKAIPNKTLRHEYAKRWQADLESALHRSEGVLSRIYKLYDKSLQERHFEISFKVHMDSNIVCLNDLTELLDVQKDLEESRARFKLFMDHFPGAAFIKDNEGKYFFVNKWHTDMLNKPEKDIIKTSPDKYWQKTRKQIQEQDQLVLKTNSPQDFNDIILHQNNEYHYLTRKFPIPFNNASPLIGGISFDVTDKYFNDKEKEEMHRQILHSTKLASIGELAAGIAHEIRNPLAIIKGHNESLSKKISRSDFEKEQASELLAKQEIAISRIATIVNGLKNFARSDADQIESINVHMAINETLDLISHIYEKDGVKIITHYSNQRDLHINGNIGKFQQVIMNILSNAKYAMRNQNKKTIVLETSKRKDFIRINITDTGEGIDKKNHNQIFDPFFTTKPFGEGTGLGLGIIKSIVEGINGKINFSSKPGKTTFKLTIPLISPPPVRPPKIKTYKYYRLKGTALVVDDEEDIREILSCYMEELGLVTYEAENGKDALEKLQKHPFDLIITDMKMPVMDGRELLRHLEKNPIKKIVISGNLSGHEEMAYADAYLEKPFDKEKMFQTLSHVLTHR